MKLSSKLLFTWSYALGFASGIACAQDPSPTVFAATSAGNTGAAPNGIAASRTELLFTQPYFGATAGVGGAAQTRGVYSENLTLGTATFMTGLPTNGVTAENGVAIATGASGFTAGDVFATAASSTAGLDDIYKNGVLFISGVPAAVSAHQTFVGFDSVGTFGGVLLVSADTAVRGYSSSGTLLFTYPLPAPFNTTYVLQDAEVAPLTYSACPGCLYVTSMPKGNINNPVPGGNGEILRVSPGAPSGTPLTPVVATPFPEPESLHFVTANSLSCTLGPAPGYVYFASGYSTTLNQPVSSSGAILAWTQSDLQPYVGQILIQNEEAPPSAGSIWAFNGTSFSLFSQTNYQLEDTAIIGCQQPFTGCTVTQGGWGAPPHGNNPGALLSSKFSTVYPSGVTIGGTNTLHFTSAAAIGAFLPQGGPPAALTSSVTDPTSRTSAGVFAGQVLALQLNVDINGFGSLVLSGTGTSLDGKTVAQILSAANIALGGGPLPSGFSYSSLNDLIDNLNSAFDGCVANSFATTHLH